MPGVRLGVEEREPIGLGMARNESFAEIADPARCGRGGPGWPCRASARGRCSAPWTAMAGWAWTTTVGPWARACRLRAWPWWSSATWPPSGTGSPG